MDTAKKEAQLRLAVANGESKRACALALELNSSTAWEELVKQRTIGFADLPRILDDLEKAHKHTHFVAHAVLDHCEPTQEELLGLALRVKDSSMQYRLWSKITWQGVSRAKAIKIAHTGWLWTHFWKSLIRAYNLKENELDQFKRDHGIALTALCEIGHVSKARMWRLAMEKKISWSTVLHCADLTIGELAQIQNFSGGFHDFEDYKFYGDKVRREFRKLEEKERIEVFLEGIRQNPRWNAPFVQAIFDVLDMAAATREQLEAIGRTCGHWSRVLDSGKFSQEEILHLAEKYDHPDLWKRVGVKQ